MTDITQIIKEEVQNFYEEINDNTNNGFVSFGDHLRSISETDEEISPVSDFSLCLFTFCFVHSFRKAQDVVTSCS